tara:strand:- start:234 stop:2498 length:2265 start_codon:yes stop_codon:yes gene_type:complete
MLNRLHKIPGLLAALLVSLLAVSGAVLSVFPLLDWAGAVRVSDREITLTQLAERVVRNYPQIEQIRRTPAGRITGFYFENDRPGQAVLDPATGRASAAYAPSAVARWTRKLHRALLLDDAGRLTAGLGALALLALTLSGLQITARRQGGWRRLAARAQGTRRQRLHVDLGRLAAPGLILSAATAIYLSLAWFAVIPQGPAAPGFPAQVTGGPPLPVGKIAAFDAIALADLRALTFPDSSDPTDAYHLATAQGEGYIDQATGQVLVWQAHGLARQAYELIYRLHTGQGLWWLSLLLGLSALAVPVIAVSGVLIWWARRRATPRIKANRPAQIADTIILVGSENGSTWGFADTLHQALTARGHKVHTAPMNSLAGRYRMARRMLILTATHGDGQAPASAQQFMARLAARPDVKMPVAVLGFGDRQFPKFCGFAHAVEAALAQRNWDRLMPLGEIDRQSAQAFAQWGVALGAALETVDQTTGQTTGHTSGQTTGGETLILRHSPPAPRTHTLTLQSRQDYGQAVQAPTAILRFSLPRRSLLSRLTGRALPRFEAGDLVGILPPGSDQPRFYSLASATRQGRLEICVGKQPGGLCSNYLHGCVPGDQVTAFIQPNRGFRPTAGRVAVILIGAGSGIGPLAGFISANRRRRPMYLLFGARHPASDYLYREDIDSWLSDGRLTGVATAFSRVQSRTYVQDRLRQEAQTLRGLIADGAQILVCGGRDMAAGVEAALADILAPIGLTPALLKAGGRYAEDVY